MIRFEILNILIYICILIFLDFFLSLITLFYLFKQWFMIYLIEYVHNFFNLHL